MMPTLIELAGLPPCQELLGGKSLAAVIANPPANGTAAEFPYAFSQFPRCNCTYQTNDLDTLNGTCPQVYHNPYTSETGATGACNHHVCLFDPKETFDWMGYSVRSDGFRYTLFVAWDGAALKPRWDQVWGEELYDHRADRYVCTLARYRFTPIQSNPFRPLPVAFCLLFCVAFCCHDSSCSNQSIQICDNATRRWIIDCTECGNLVPSIFHVCTVDVGVCVALLQPVTSGW
eukprot:m.400477 g.400477  ORF g.400477 m.400477 type:complete len:232 (-) comp21159_c0_seq25:465-1160(-)